MWAPVCESLQNKILNWRLWWGELVGRGFESAPTSIVSQRWTTSSLRQVLVQVRDAARFDGFDLYPLLPGVCVVTL